MFNLLLTIYKSGVILVPERRLIALQFTIKQARHFAGFTQAELAKRLGIDRGTYIKIEKEPPRATIGQISKISALTGIPVGDIFLGCKSTFVDKPTSN